VLLITTKRGKQGRAKVSYDGWVGWTEAFNLLPLLNAQEYTTIKNEGLTNLGTPPNGTSRGFYTQNGPDGKLIDTRWYDEVYRTGMGQSHAVNVSGASDKTTYFMSAGYTKQEGMLKGNDFKRLTTRMNLDHKVNKWLGLGGNFSYTNSQNFGPNSGSLPGQAFSIAGLGRLPLVLAPNVAPRNADGTYNINTVANTIGQGNNLTALSFYNPAFILAENKFSSESDRILANVYGQINILDGLTFRSNYGIDYLTTVNKEFRAALHGDGTQFGGAAQNTNQSYRRWNWQNTLNYIKSFGNHNLAVLVGNEQQYTYQEGWGADRRNQADPFYDEYQGGFNTIVPAGTFIGENYLASFFARINYDYKGKYLLSLNGRRDGYSAFAPDNKYGNFGGVSAGWVISQEDFWKNSGIAKTISNLKLRGSYGIVGNFNGINDYAWYSFFSTGLYGTQAQLFFSQAGNSNLTWETSKKLDLGLEMGFFNGRLNVEATYFNNDIDNLILNEPQAPSRGIPGNSITANVGRMVNNGLELTISGTPVRTKDFQWTSSFNITTLNNEVKELAAGNADIFPATSGLERSSIIRVGESIGSFYAVRTGGVNPANGQRIFYYRDGRAVQYNHAAPAASRWTFVEGGGVAPRGVDQASDGMIFGPALPKWTGGWDNTVRYKSFDFNILFFFSGGNYIYNGTKAGLRDNRNWNSMKTVTTRWQKAGDQTDIPRVVFGDNISNGSGIVISENVEKGDFLKARNISLGYSLPQSLVSKANMSSFRAYVAVQNAFTITNYTGFDPEVSANGNENGNPSVDRNSVGQARTITVGVNVGF
jgi:TonB-linked SusC/RagA family outer membrane protein